MENTLWIIEPGSSNRRKAKETICKQCKESFLQRTSGNKEYCSHECSMKSRKKRLNLVCSNCNIGFERCPSKTVSASHGFHFCSRKCKEKAQSMSGNVSKIRPSHYGTGRGDWQVEKFYSDNVQKGCACGERRPYLLQVHHKDGDKSNNRFSNFELVCGNCHIKRHLMLINGEWTYWTKSLTPRELLDEL